MYDVSMTFKEMPTDGIIMAFVDIVRISHPLTIRINDIRLEYDTPYGMGAHWTTYVDGEIGGQAHMQRDWAFSELKELLDKRYKLESVRPMPKPKRKKPPSGKMRRPPSRFTEVDA